MRIILLICGIALGATGGVIAYRAAFLEPSAEVIVNSTGAVREAPNMFHLIGGIALLLLGAAMAFLAAMRKR